MIKTLKASAIALTLAFSLTGCEATQHVATHSDGYETYISPGQVFKHTQFIDINNNSVVLGEKRKLVILFATWCSDSKRTLNELKASPLLADKQLQIIAVGREENAESLGKFNQAFKLPFPLIADPKRDIYNHYANKGVPRLILLDENNRVVKTLIGEQANIIDQVIW